MRRNHPPPHEKQLPVAAGLTRANRAIAYPLAGAASLQRCPGCGGGTRTRDIWSMDPAIYRLIYPAKTLLGFRGRRAMRPLFPV
jgi:hypothetical protein